MKLVNWVLLSFLLLVAADVVFMASLWAFRAMTLKTCQSSGDMKREVHEVYPLLEK